MEQDKVNCPSGTREGPLGDKILAVMGSPGSGKTTTAVKLAAALARQKKNVIVVFCDPFTPVMPVLLAPDAIHDTSLGELLTAPGLTQANILNACVPVQDSDYISLLGYKSGESLMQYPKITRDKAVELFVSLRYLADYIILDCAAVFEADPASFVGIEIADRVLRLGTANLKGISYFQTHNPMLEDSRFDKGRFQTAIGCLKVGQDWEAVSGQYGGVDHVMPYVAELEQQDNERTLFQPLKAQESFPYNTEIDRLLGNLFGLQTAAAFKGKGVKKGKASTPPAPAQAARPAKAKGGFKLPFAKRRGEF